MSTNETHKLRLLYIMQMLNEQTDAERGLSMTQIIANLADLGISAERKAIYRDIDVLREFGMDIETYQRAPLEYGLATRDFSFPELLLLVDAVQGSRFLTERKSRDLVASIRQLAVRDDQTALDKRIHVEGRIKMQNESVYYNVDRIQEAIAQRRKISFIYVDYDVAKRKVPRRDEGRYEETAVQLIYSDGYYYLVAFNDRHEGFTNYRVDRMTRLEMTDEPATRNAQIANFDVAEYGSRIFGMFHGEPTAAALKVNAQVMNAVIDRFGKDVHSEVIDDDFARVHVHVIESPVFYGWLAQFGTLICIEQPKKLRANYRAFLEGIAEGYRE